MRGSVVKRGGTYSLIYDEPRADGKRRQRWLSGFRTRKAAELKLGEILGRIGSGDYVEPAQLTFGAYLRERWLPAREPSLRATTFDGYQRAVVRHIVPQVGHHRLQGLTADALSRFYAERLATGLSARTVRYHHAIVHKSLADAMKWGLVVRNVADAAEPPSAKAAKAPPPRTWSAAELRAFLEHVAEDRLYALWLTYATTGMRRGEALAIRWAALDLDAGQLSVRAERVVVAGVIHESEPKSARGLRTVALDAGTVATLRAHRKRQLEERMAWGPAYADDGLVFCREDGTALHPSTVSKRFGELVADLDVPRVSLHGLRHTWASLALQASVNPKVVSERLGHASVAFTLDRYSHVMPGMQEDAAAAVAALIATR